MSDKTVDDAAGVARRLHAEQEAKHYQLGHSVGYLEALEAAAKVCDDAAKFWDDDKMFHMPVQGGDVNHALELCAESIRALAAAPASPVPPAADGDGA